MENEKKIQSVEVEELQKNEETILLNHIVDSMFDGMSKAEIIQNVRGYPVAGVYLDNNGNFRLDIAVTGFSKDEINIFIKEGLLVVVGQLKKDIQRQEFTKIGGELKIQDFEKKIKIPYTLDISKIQSCYEKGMLVIIIPFAPEHGTLKEVIISTENKIET